MINKILKLANMFESTLKTYANVDVLESYPGEDSSNQVKLEAASAAALDDLKKVTEVYLVYESQMHQAHRSMKHQKYLLKFAKKIQILIDNTLASGNIDVEFLNDQLHNIRKEAIEFGNSAQMKISLSELHSFRLLQALITDEAAKKHPKIPPPNWSEIAKSRRMDEAPSSSSVPTILSNTLKSPGSPEHTHTRPL